MARDKNFEKYENLDPEGKKGRLKALAIGGGGLTAAGAALTAGHFVQNWCEENHKRNPDLYKAPNPKYKGAMLKSGIPLLIIGSTGLGLRAYHKHKDKKSNDIKKD